MKSIVTVILSILICVMLQGVAGAKCPLRFFILTGGIKEANSNKIIPDVKLYIFYDDQQSSLAGGYSTTKSYSAISDNSGKYEATNYFDSYSSWSFFGDKCNNEPKSIEIIATHDNYYTQKIIHKTRELTSITGKDENKRFTLPTIFLAPLKTEK